MALYNKPRNTSQNNDFIRDKQEQQEEPIDRKQAFRFMLFRDEKSKKIAGFFLLMFSIFLMLSFTSFLFSWNMDQDVVIASDWKMFIQQQPEAASNWMGMLGAITAHLFIYKWFGLASYAFVLIFFLWGFRILFKTNLLPMGKTLRYSFFIVIWTSIFLGFLLSSSFSLMGGAFGHHTYLWLKGLVGMVGVAMVLLVYLVTFMVVVFNINFFLPRPLANLVGQLQEDGNTVAVAPVAETAAEPEEEIFDEAELQALADEIVLKPDPEAEVAVQQIEAEVPVVPVVPVDPLTTLVAAAEPEISPVTVFNLDPQVKAMDKKADPAPLKLDIIAPAAEEEIIPEVKPVPEAHANVDAEHIGLDTPYDPRLDLSNYQFPTLDLLNAYEEKRGLVDAQELEESKNLIVETLKNYSIGISQIKATIGPTVTLYEIVPAPGVKISRIKNLEDDIALSLAALGIRIIAPIPGRGTIGIEVPNKNPEMVAMRTALASSKFQHTEYDLPVCLGKTIQNEVYVADLTKMPHLLMAGATGQGKSVGLNALLVSILYKKHPSEVKFVLVDPKKVELTLFKAIERHFLAKLPGDGESIITDNKLVINTLNSLCIEMDKRYELLQQAQVRNIKEYNVKFKSRRLNPNDGHKFLPYIVVVIDEVADLIMTAGKEVEHPIGRLAQLARAIGIHLVLATQRPSVNIITGTIKANFPARVAFRVTSKIDSRTILDASGADQLIGKGDMLFSNGNDMVRLQCPFVDTPEVEKITAFIGGQRGYGSAFILPEYVDESAAGANEDFDPSERDNLFTDAAKMVVLTQQGSTSLLQRKLKIGYNRAGRLIDQLEHFGIVGPFEGSKAREVLIPDESSLEQLLKNIDQT